jgi:uncharacterized protein YbjT (DUF2867 family)
MPKSSKATPLANQHSLGRLPAWIQPYTLFTPWEHGWDFSRLDRNSAENFLEACLEQGVQKIIYLGGLGLRESASAHLASRIETGEILASRPDRIRTVWFRAGVILGSGSTSFEIIRHLTEKLPVMITPRWVKTLTQPIGIDDVVSYLIAALSLDPPENIVVDIGAPPMTFLEMLRQTAKVMGLRRLILPVPFLSPRLSSYWLTLMTPVPFKVGAALVEGLKSETLMQNDHARQYFPAIHPEPFPEAVRRAINELENDLVLSRWCDSSPAPFATSTTKLAPVNRSSVTSGPFPLPEWPRNRSLLRLSAWVGKMVGFPIPFSGNCVAG